MGGIETGTGVKNEVIGRGVGSLKRRKIRRGTARRDAEDVALDLKRMTDPTVIPDVVLTRRTSHIVLPDPAPTLTRKTNHVVLPDVVLILTRRASHIVLPDPAPTPTRKTNHAVLPDVILILTRRKAKIHRIALHNALNVLTDPVHHAVVLSHPAVLPLLHHHPLFRPKWTSISRKHMIPS